jgi:hypothetical protein
VYFVLWRIFAIVMIVRWGYAFARVLRQPAEWEPPRHQTWPLRLHRNGYLIYLGLFLVALAVSLVLTRDL